ncbi:MAG: spore cortex biosynthesis protein YabQ [Lachnospiraceae bacterium]
MSEAVNPSILDELWLLGSSFLLGIGLMVFYDGIRLFRALIPQGFWAVALEDLVFWAISSIAIFVLLFVFNEGRIRFYALLAVGLGMLLYYAVIGKRWPPYLRRMIQKHRNRGKAERKSGKEVAKKAKTR